MKASAVVVHFIILFFLVISSINGKEKCPVSTCNYESDCYKEEGRVVCECIGDFFKGDFCETPKDNCVSNPCRNGGTCHPYLGHYYCECPTGFSDQTCSSKSDILRAVHIHYNHLAPIGEKQAFLITMEYRGNERIFMELITPNNLVEGFVYQPPGSEFRLSNGLRAISRKLGLRHSDLLPYDRGYYRVVHGIFYKLESNALNFQIREYAGLVQVYLQTFSIYIYNPKKIRCLPNAVVHKCSSPLSPLSVDIAVFNFYEPVVRTRCDPNSHFDIRWSIRSFADTKVLKVYGKDTSTALIVYPYSLWFNYRDAYARSYLIRGDTYEVTKKGIKLGFTVVRCYIKVEAKPVQARIIGGDQREVGFDSSFTIDSSISRDYARNPRKKQELVFKWTCTTDGIPTSQCSEDMGSKPRLRIPSRVLTLGQTYSYQVSVRSSIHVKKTDNGTQEIKVVAEPRLVLQYFCLRNCEDSQFAAGKLIHLKLACVECPRGEQIYSVTNNRDDVVATNQHVVLTDEKGPQIVLNATIQIGNRRGSIIITLSLNPPPASGSCSTDPKEGTAYETAFKISCRGFKDDNLPLSYTYYAGTSIIEERHTSTLKTTLFPTSGNTCELKIRICDNFNACTDVELQVNMNPLKSEVPWLDFISQNDSDLQKLLNNGERDAAFTLIQSVIPHISPAEGLEITKHVVKCFRNYQIRRLVATEHVLTISKNLFEATELSSESAFAVSELFSKVAQGLLTAIRNGEVFDLLLETQEEMLGDVITSMKKASSEMEEFPLVHDAEPPPGSDPFQENYPDYGELKLEEVIHISNWLKSFTRMHKCMQVMGVVSAFIQLPDENPSLVNRTGIASRTLVIEKAEPVSVSWQASSTLVDLPNSFLSSLKGDQLAVQVSIFEENPFWWCPEQYKPDTEVLSVGAYTRDLSSLKSTSTKATFSYFMSIKDRGSSQAGTPMEGSIDNPKNVVIYERVLPPHAVLVITFTHLDNDIRVLLLAGEKPRSYMLNKAKTVKASKDNATDASLHLVNRRNKDTDGFIMIASDSKVTYSFDMVTRLCVSWDEKLNEWTSRFCSVGYKTNATHIHCLCKHLSMFAGKVHPTFAHQQAPIELGDGLPFNFNLLAFYLIVILFLCLILWLTWRRREIDAQCLVALHSKPGPDHKYEYIVTIYTNGHELAATSSSVTVQLHGSKMDSEEFTLYPGDRCAFFERLNQTSFKIASRSQLGTLLSISIYHDSLGRYPSWNCHAVKVKDQWNEDQYMFSVNKWLSNVESDTCALNVPLSKKADVKTRKQIFRDTLSDVFANWYAQQSICSLRLYGDLTALEKISIFILRVCVVLIVTLIVFGPTTMMTYEEEREIYYSMLPDYGDLFLMAFCCHVLGVLLGAIAYRAFLKLRPKRRGVKYSLVYRK